MADNGKTYIHEFVDIVGHGRPNYMHHMTAWWAPVRRAHRQLCVGVWAEVGTTGRWPRTVNLWEQDGWTGMAFHLGYEASGRHGDFEPEEAEWWSQATAWRRGGRDRVMVGASWTRTVEQLIADRVRGACYLHELVEVRRGHSGDYLDLVETEAIGRYDDFGIVPVGGYQRAMSDNREAVVIWAVPNWDAWANFEAAWMASADLDRYRRMGDGLIDSFERIVLTDNPLNPLVLGRQPHESDRRTDLH